MNSFRHVICVKALAGPIYFDPKSYRRRHAYAARLLLHHRLRYRKDLRPTLELGNFGPFNEHLCPSGEEETTSKEHLRRLFSALVPRIQSGMSLALLGFAPTLQRETSWQGTTLSCPFSCFSSRDAGQ